MVIWYFLLIPVVWVLVSKIIWPNKISNKEMLLHLAAVVPITLLILGLSTFNQLSDISIKHGQITDKIRHEYSYIRSYSCNCRQICSGSGNNRICSQTCDTCYEDRYVVEWYLKSTLGNINIDSIDRTSKSVWSSPDPVVYKQAYIGEPCAATEIVQNYVKGAPNSLFNQTRYVGLDKVPTSSYPQIFGIYKVDNVIASNSGVDTSKYEEYLSEALKTLGSAKQVNIILHFSKGKPKEYKYALERAWLGGKKNDLVVLIDTLDGKTVNWVDAFTFGLSMGNQEMLIKITDELRNSILSPEITIPIITKHVQKEFKRKPMSDFKYLNKEITPPMWLLVLVFVLQIGLNSWLTTKFKNEDIA